MPEVGEFIAERYRLTRKLGEGGMGSVWAAHDRKLRRDVAIKLLTERIADSETALGRFEREAMAVARLHSPYIAQVYDYGVEDGSPYIIMELLNGEDLKAVLARSKRLGIDETGRVIQQVAKALHAAHASGIVHRDLKPGNVFIASEHGEEVCKVFDFGVAKALTDLGDDSDTTQEGQLLGTPRYMSPEQAHGAKAVDHRTDLWSLGVIAYQCLTGRLPFVAVGTGHVLVKICTEEPDKPSDIHYALPPEVDAFIARALAKEPEDRFQSAKELAMAFAGLSDDSLTSFSGAPSWSGSHRISRSSMDSMDHSFDPSDPAISRELLGGASFADTTKSDGTLGATMAPAKPWLGSRRARVGAGLFAIAAIGVLVTVALTRKPASTPAAAPAPPTSAVEPLPEPTASSPAPAAPASSDPAVSASPSVTPSAAPAPRHRTVGPRPKKPDPKADPKPEPAPEPKPKPKPKGDGLDLFDKRF